MKGACCLFFLTGYLPLGHAAFIKHGDNPAATFVTRSYKYIHPVPRELRPFASSSKLRSSLPNDVPSSFNDKASLSSLEDELPSNLAWFKQHFNFSEDVLDRIAVSYPRLLTLDQSELVTRANWLQKRLKMNNEEFKVTIRRFPNILTYRPDTNLGPTLDVLQEKFAFNTKTLSRVVQKNPSMLGGNLVQTLHLKLDWIQTRLLLNETKTMQKLVAECPTILSLGVDNLEPKLTWLHERLNLTESQIAKLLVKAPTIMTQNIADNLEPKLDWLQDRLDLNQTQLGKMIRRAPKTLTYSVDSLEQKVNWLRKRLCLDDESVRKIFMRQPAIFQYSTSKKIGPTLQWLQEQLFLVEDGDVGKLVGRCPSLLDMNIVTNLEPTLNFFKESIGEDAAINMVVKYPYVFTYSLKKRLKPRLEHAEQIGIEIDSGCLMRIAKLTNEKWHKSLNYQSKKLKLEDSLW